MPSIPDEQIHPHATGAAAKTVEDHQKPCDLLFHGSWFCPYVQARHRLSLPSPVATCQAYLAHS